VRPELIVVSRYKREKEAFVSDLEGTSMSEIYLTLIVFPLGVLASNVVGRVLLGTRKALIWRYIIEFFMVVVPCLVVMTFTEYTQMVVLLLVQTTLIFGAISALSSRISKSELILDRNVMLENSDRMVHISGLRSGLLLLTCIAILAVDFKIFPRRFAKTETYGTGLMDVGVGGFVVANAVVFGARARKHKGFDLFSCLSNITPLICLGFYRLALVKGIEYQEHVSEYGVHWNFFFTLAFVLVGIEFIFSCGITRVIPCPGLLGATVIIFFQLALHLGLESWILNAPRVNFLTANKEGITTLPGYIGLHLVGVWLGGLQVPQGLRCATRFNWNWYIVKQWAVFVGLWMFTIWSNEHIAPVSRRLVNLTYIVWVVSIAQLMMVLLLSSQILLPEYTSICSVPLLVDSLNGNALLVFLLGNLLTGLCNQAIKTLHVPAAAAFQVLLAYCLVLTAIPAYLHARGLRLRLKPATAVNKP